MNGKKSIRSLTGLRRDSEVMYVGTYETQIQQIGRRGKISDVWGTLSKAQSTPDLLGDRSFDEDAEQRDGDNINGVRDTAFLQEPASIFNRPGFGSVAFRRAVKFHLYKFLSTSPITSFVLRGFSTNSVKITKVTDIKEVY